MKELIKIIKQTKSVVVVAVVIGVIFGLIYHSVPKKYLASGSLYITRNLDKISEDYFIYEGYYSQQTAKQYVNTVMGMVESTDLMREVLENMQIDVTGKNLRYYRKQVKTKKSGPQLITITTRGTNLKETEKFWDTLTKLSIDKSKEINIAGDPQLRIVQISESPTVTEGFNSLALNTIVGGGITVLLYTFWVAFNKYYS